MKYGHRTIQSFWECYAALPQDVRARADKQFALLLRNPAHPSLQLKRVGALWAVRVSKDWRGLAMREADTFYWFWIGGHDEYERLLKG